MHLDARVHPGWRGRGVGGALLDWQVARGAEMHAERDAESWRLMYAGRTAFRPDLSTLALADGAVAG